MNELIKIQNVEIKQDGDLINLTDIWKASGLDHKKKPSFWKEYLGGPLINELISKSSNPDFKAWHVIRGGRGGTFAHWQIALSYAKWLSPELHLEVNKTYMRAKSGDVTLADEISDKASQKDQIWLKKRLDGKIARLEFTTTLKDHDVKGYGYVSCTDQINVGILSQTAKEFREERGLKKNEVRDNMTQEQLAAIELAEMVSARKIKEEGIMGNARCSKKCGDVASGIRLAIQ